MTRRSFLATAPALVAAQTPTPGNRRPNILFVISDQFRADNLGCLGQNPTVTSRVRLCRLSSSNVRDLYKEFFGEIRETGAA